LPAIPNSKESSLGERSYKVLPGQYFDKETNTHYNYFRDYDPASGRYVESDPIGLGGGINPYAYVGGNPLTLVDSWGLCRLKAAYWTTAPALTNFSLNYQGVTDIHAPRISSMLTIYMFQTVWLGSASLNARAECQWECECGQMKLTVTGVNQPLSKQFNSPVGINIFTAAFGGKGYAGIAAIAAAHITEGAINAAPFVSYALGVRRALLNGGPAALCNAQGPPQ
jgi:RHS repeat-associated protein